MDWFNSFDPIVQAAIISVFAAIVTSIITVILATPLRYAIDKRALKHKLNLEYKYEQRKKLRELIGRYHGQINEALERLNYRIWNLYNHETEGWLDVDDNDNNPGVCYYFTSTVYRFISVFAVIRQFELEEIYVDGRIADKNDLEFVKFTKALQWCIIDVALFHDLNYDSRNARDHFFSDDLRRTCDLICCNSKIISLGDFESKMKQDEIPTQLLNFFNGLCQSEERLRWDRIVALHVLVMAFLNSFGYDMQRSSKSQFSEVLAKIKNEQVINNLVSWMPKLGIDRSKGIRHIIQY